MQQQIDVFVASLTSFWTQLAGFVPQLLAAMILLFLGWILANIARSAMGKILDTLKFDELGKRSGIEAFMREGNIDLTLSRLIANLVYWIILLVVIVTVANSLGLTTVAELFNKVVFYLPNIIVAVLVLVFGVLVARFINRLVFAYLNNMGVDGALTLSTMAEYAVIIFVVFVALEQLQIGTQLLITAFQIGFGAIGLAFALAFGLAGKDWATSVIKRLTEKK
jgi:small-conductance mechanosensitive channel